MKLSEAIRLGAMQGPQCKTYFGENGATCANGAAALAVGIREGEMDLLTDAFPSLRQVAEWPRFLGNRPWHRWGNRYFQFVKPISGCLFTVINILNLYYTREQITTWIEHSGYDCEYVPLKTEEWDRQGQETDLGCRALDTVN